MSEKGVSRSSSDQRYTLPDGQEISIGSEAFRAPEPLFAPFLGLAETVRRAIEAADGSLAEELWGGILLVSPSPEFLFRFATNFKKEGSANDDDDRPGGIPSSQALQSAFSRISSE